VPDRFVPTALVAPWLTVMGMLTYLFSVALSGGDCKLGTWP